MTQNRTIIFQTMMLSINCAQQSGVHAFVTYAVTVCH